MLYHSNSPIPTAAAGLMVAVAFVVPLMALINVVLAMRLVVDMMAKQQLVEMVLDKRYTIYLKKKGFGIEKKKYTDIRLKKKKAKEHSTQFC